MPKNDGGPAFPSEQGKVDGQWNYTIERGMTLRDWFAGKALAELAHPQGTGDPGEAARQAYRVADAMLAERERVDNTKAMP